MGPPEAKPRKTGPSTAPKAGASGDTSGYHYIIIGAGASGCVLASVLAHAHPERRIALLDLGPPDVTKEVAKGANGNGEKKATQEAQGCGSWLSVSAARLLRDPRRWGAVALGTRPWSTQAHPYQRPYLSTPQGHLGGRVVYQPRGVGAGGSTLINAMQYARGYVEDYEVGAGWPGKDGWSRQDMEQSFKCVESCLPLLVCPANPVGLAFKQAAQECGLAEGVSGPGVFVTPQSYAPVTYMMAQQQQATDKGSGNSNKSQGSRERVTAYDAFVRPVLAKQREEGRGGGLEVLCHTMGYRVLIQDGRAVGVFCLRTGPGVTKPKQKEEEEFFLTLGEAEGAEVVVCAGALETPRVLMLSGIGERERLEQLGIGVVTHAPDVGQGLQDHWLAPVRCLPRRMTDKGHIALNSMHGWVNLTHHNPQGCRTQLLACDFTLGPDICLETGIARFPTPLSRVCRFLLGFLAWLLLYLCPPLRHVISQGLGYLVCVMNAKAMGSVTITSKDPRQPLHIDPQAFAHPDDVCSLALGIRHARALLHTNSMQASYSRPTEIFPGPLFDIPTHPQPSPEAKGEEWVKQIEAPPLTQRELDGVRHYASMCGGTYFHPVGTCRLGKVTDHRARVKGIKQGNLRVADVSLLNAPVGVGTVGVAMMIGDRVARLMLQDEKTVTIGEEGGDN